jgi:hypothetical protein
MPTLSSTDHLIPRSTIRHRPIDPNPDAQPEVPPWVRRASRSSQTQTQTQAPKGRTTKVIPVPQTTQAKKHASHQQHWLVFLGIGMLLSLIVVCLGQLFVGWFATTRDNLEYGYPRTFQVDMFVGHETGKIPSHFIALNLHGRIEVIEFPGGDASHAKIYMGPQLYDTNADLIPVTLSFVDTKHNHHPDMFVQFNTTQILFHNVGNTFQPA